MLKFCLVAFALLTPALHLCACGPSIAVRPESPSARVLAQEATHEPSMLVQYLEVVSSDVDATCSVLAKVHGVTFGEPDAALGNARTAVLVGGGRIGVRPPMAEHDLEVVRPYMLVDDIEAAVAATEAAGGEFLMGATELPGGGKFAIYLLAGTQFGLWETPASEEAPR